MTTNQFTKKIAESLEIDITEARCAVELLLKSGEPTRWQQESGEEYVTAKLFINGNNSAAYLYQIRDIDSGSICTEWLITLSR